VRRERYVGPWLPEPLVAREDADDPLTAVVRDETVRMAAMVVLEQLVWVNDRDGRRRWPAARTSAPTRWPA